MVDSPNGRVAVGWLIVEDLAMVLALVLLPAFAEVLGGKPLLYKSSVHGPVIGTATVGGRPYALSRRCALKRPSVVPTAVGGRPPSRSDLDLLGDLQGIIDLDTKVPDSRLKLGMAK